ncbi:alpha/beta fold hydrolase [Pelagibacterium montanilacus]|uniref:alpha/beta fold hydrolase n=1 Tax=Pelagibacterium montanilacus TaxID=2185280 RepID=UPI0013E07FCB|nr:alpha/beta hydrolase [Pelagibacterium montanilacus]
MVTTEGDLLRVRDGWLLALGLGFLAWSLLGRFLIPLVLAKPDSRKTHSERADGKGRSKSGERPYVEEHGEQGPAIVLTHGWSLDSTAWYYAKHDLSQDFKLITWDLPGMGRSKSVNPISLSGFAEELRRLIGKRSSGEPVVLVGHSIGGMTIQTLAQEHPELFTREVAGIVLLNTTYTNPLKTIIFSRLMQALQKPILEPAMHLTKALQPLIWVVAWQSYLSGWTHVANRFGFGKYVTRSQLEHVSLLTTRNSPGNVAQGNLAMFNWDATGALAELSIPILVIGGTMDIVTKPEASKALAASNPHARLLLIEGVNHMGFMERPELYNAAIAEFVSEIFRRRDGLERTMRSAPTSMDRLSE